MGFALRPTVLLEPMWSRHPERWPHGYHEIPSDEHPQIIRSEVDGSHIGTATSPAQLAELTRERIEFDSRRRL